MRWDCSCGNTRGRRHAREPREENMFGFPRHKIGAAVRSITDCSRLHQAANYSSFAPLLSRPSRYHGADVPPSMDGDAVGVVTAVRPADLSSKTMCTAAGTRRRRGQLGGLVAPVFEGDALRAAEVHIPGPGSPCPANGRLPPSTQPQNRSNRRVGAPCRAWHSRCYGVPVHSP